PLDDLRCQRDDLHKPLVAQFATHWTEDAGATGLRGLALQNHSSVLIKLDVRAVFATAFLSCAHDDRLDDLATLHVTAGNCVLDSGDNSVTDAGVTALGSAEYTDY